MFLRLILESSGNLSLVFGSFPHGDFLTHQDKTSPRMVEMAKLVHFQRAFYMSKEKGDVSFSTSGLLKWQTTTFFSGLIPPFCDKCRPMHEKDHHLPGLLVLIENVFKYCQKFTIRVSLSIFVNKNVRTHSTTVVNCFFRLAHREQYREENTSSIALNLPRIEIKSCCMLDIPV